jgi:hypothetical protein
MSAVADLIRCTIRLLVPQLLENGKVNKEIAEELCKVFEGGEPLLL